MNWTEDQIEELLNGFIDEELSPRQHTEVQRLIAHDHRIAKRLQELQKCKTLVSSLPFVEAPAEMTDDIKVSLERTALLCYHPQPVEQRIGARHLLLRRLTAVAAMLALLAVLGTLVYTIVAPEDVADRTVAIEAWQQPITEQAAPAPAAETPGLALTGFNGRLEFKTPTLIAVSASISRAIEDNGLLEKVSVEAEANKSVYALTCSRDALNLLLADLEAIWPRFDSAALFVETGLFSTQVVVEDVSAEQIAEIAGQDSFDGRIEMAKDFAVLNKTAELLPGREILVAVDNSGPDLITIPKPILTSSEKTIKKSAQQEKDEKDVHLTIVVEGR